MLRSCSTSNIRFITASFTARLPKISQVFLQIDEEKQKKTDVTKERERVKEKELRTRIMQKLSILGTEPQDH